MAEDSPSWPMDLFMNDRDLPLLELQQGAEIPPPYRDLLVHMREMTPTLEAYYGSSIHIEPLQVLDGQLTFTREHCCGWIRAIESWSTGSCGRTWACCHQKPWSCCELGGCRWGLFWRGAG